VAVRVRADGRVLCAAAHPEEPGDAYLDDGLHYRLSVELDRPVLPRASRPGRYDSAGLTRLIFANFEEAA
jgi:hypothetical protein